MKLLRRLDAWANTWTGSQFTAVILLTLAFTLLCLYQNRVLHQLSEKLKMLTKL